MTVLPETGLVVGDREKGAAVRLDPRSGLPTALLSRDVDEPFALALSARLVTGGREVFVPPHSLGYADTVDHTDLRLLEPPRSRVDGPAEVHTVVTRVGDWTLAWEYTFLRGHPRLRIAVDAMPDRAPDGDVLRDLVLDLVARPADLDGWLVEAPGNELRPGVPPDALTEPTPVATVGGSRGSTGVVALHGPAGPTLAVWPVCRTEIGDCTLQGEPDGLRLTLRTGVAARLEPHESVRYDALYVDLVGAPWERVRDDVPSWYPTLGIATPQDRPDWVTGASIYEVQLGYSPFLNGYRYQPYPDVADLRADLGRIAGLGYDTLQLMPRQPYPSYNVHDYADITTTYGDEAELRALVDDAHTRGIRVIVDILMHGVIDKVVMRRIADRVRGGAYFARLGESTARTWGNDADATDSYAVAWSRHILDFEPYWSGGSPARHPLLDEHPEWFMRDSAGDVIGVYTHAFDAANAAWQEYFCAATEDLVRRLGIDGFRFDAPTYNDLPNWSPATRRRASYSPLGCLELFDRIRRRLKAIDPSLVLYTEPSGVLFREAMDITYNYDEQWLVPAVMRSDVRNGVRNGSELAAWFRDRNAVLPAGSVIAHHVDSHDTFWWPLPGEKWRREQYGVAAVRALLAVFALSGGTYMTFVGGEQDIEQDVRRVHDLRAELAAWSCDYEAVDVDDDHVYAVLRRSGSRWCLVLVNLSDRPVQAACSLDPSRVELPDRALRDVWDDADLGAAHTFEASFDAYQVRVVR